MCFIRFEMKCNLLSRITTGGGGGVLLHRKGGGGGAFNKRAHIGLQI